MTRLLALTLAAAALALGAPAAHATHTYEGGCGYDAAPDYTEEVTRPDVWTGVAYTATVITNPPGAEATVTCELRVNGVMRTSATFQGTGVVVGASGIQFHAGPYDVVNMCEVVTAGGHTETLCAEATQAQIPPQEVWDLLYAVGDLVTELWDPLNVPAVLVADEGSGAYYRLNSRAHCAGVLAGTDRFLVNGVSETYSPHATGSTIECWIRDRSTGATYGPAVTGLPVGAQSVAVGSIDVPMSHWLVVCAESYVTYDDRPTSHYRTPGC